MSQLVKHVLFRLCLGTEDAEANKTDKFIALKEPTENDLSVNIFIFPQRSHKLARI